MKFARRLNEEKTNAPVHTTVIFNAPGTYHPPYGKTTFTVSGQGTPGNAPSGTGQAYNAPSGGNYAGTTPPSGGNYAGSNPSLFGYYEYGAGLYYNGTPAPFPGTSYYSSDSYATTVTNFTENTTYSVIQFTDLRYGYSVPASYYSYSASGDTSFYFTGSYGLATTTPGTDYYNSGSPGVAYYNPVVPGTAIYNPPSGGSYIGSNPNSGGTIATPTEYFGNYYIHYHDGVNVQDAYSTGAWGPASFVPPSYSSPVTPDGTYGYQENTLVGSNPATYNPSVPGNAIYSPVTPGTPVYTNSVSGNTGAPVSVFGIPFPGGAAGFVGGSVSPTPVLIPYSDTGISVSVPPGGYVVIQNT